MAVVISLFSGITRFFTFLVKNGIYKEKEGLDPQNSLINYILLKEGLSMFYPIKHGNYP